MTSVPETPETTRPVERIIAKYITPAVHRPYRAPQNLKNFAAIIHYDEAGIAIQKKEEPEPAETVIERKQPIQPAKFVRNFQLYQSNPTITPEMRERFVAFSTNLHNHFDHTGVMAKAPLLKAIREKQIKDSHSQGAGKLDLETWQKQVDEQIKFIMQTVASKIAERKQAKAQEVSQKPRFSKRPLPADKLAIKLQTSCPPASPEDARYAFKPCVVNSETVSEFKNLVDLHIETPLIYESFESVEDKEYNKLSLSDEDEHHDTTEAGDESAASQGDQSTNMPVAMLGAAHSAALPSVPVVQSMPIVVVFDSRFS